jgi:site-specific DNA-methyltransferase (adenine-specific)
MVWVKNHARFSAGRLDYDYQHELIWYGWKQTHHFYGQGKFKNTVWNVKKPQKAYLHPTMKPPELIEEAIRDNMEPSDMKSVEKAHNGVINNTGKDAIVLDPFAGSGSVIAACEKLKRRAFMIELEPKCCDTIALRALNSNGGLTAYRPSGGKWEAVSKAELEGGANG